ncbi:MAG: dihydrofolate reductase [Bacteroidales bacterium]|nr:dihydrofolate reductase [Candidatus Colicola faecequi]
MISIIVAISSENAIGQKGDLLCHLPTDLRHFKQITQGHTVIMGKRTWFSLPISKTTGTHALPNRTNIVISDIPGESFEGATMAYSIDGARALVAADDEAFIIGGGMIYKQFEPLADKLYITHIRHSFPEADTFFPLIDPAVWTLVATEDHPADETNPYPYTFAEYVRK